jgi:hypothetical protein
VEKSLWAADRFVEPVSREQKEVASDLPDLTNALFLRILQVVETSPELFGGLVAIGH